MQRLCRLILMLVVLLLIGAYIQKPEYIIYSIFSGSGGDTKGHRTICDCLSTMGY